MPPMDMPHWARVGAKVLRLTPYRSNEGLTHAESITYLVVEKIDNDAILCTLFYDDMSQGMINFFWRDREKRWKDDDWAEKTVYETVIRKSFQTSWDRILDDESY